MAPLRPKAKGPPAVAPLLPSGDALGGGAANGLQSRSLLAEQLVSALHELRSGHTPQPTPAQLAGQAFNKLQFDYPVSWPLQCR